MLDNILLGLEHILSHFFYLAQLLLIAQLFGLLLFYKTCSFFRKSKSFGSLFVLGDGFLIFDLRFFFEVLVYLVLYTQLLSLLSGTSFLFIKLGRSFILHSRFLRASHFFLNMHMGLDC